MWVIKKSLIKMSADIICLSSCVPAHCWTTTSQYWSLKLILPPKGDSSSSQLSPSSFTPSSPSAQESAPSSELRKCTWINYDVLDVFGFNFLSWREALLELDAFLDKFLGVADCEVDDHLFLACFRIDSQLLDDLFDRNGVFLHGGSK